MRKACTGQAGLSASRTAPGGSPVIWSRWFWMTRNSSGSPANSGYEGLGRKARSHSVDVYYGRATPNAGGTGRPVIVPLMTRRGVARGGLLN
jgi:hypothetical protein